MGNTIRIRPIVTDSNPLLQTPTSLLLVMYRKQLYCTVNNFIIFPQGQKIAEALVGTQVKAVIVSACESGKTASNALTSGLAQCLSAQGVANVIGMREAIFDRAGIQFARALCDELAQGECIDVALQSARHRHSNSLEGGCLSRREHERGSRTAWDLPDALKPANCDSSSLRTASDSLRASSSS